MVRTDFIETPMVSASTQELKIFNKVSNILASEVDVVSRFLVKRILESTKTYDRIEYLTKTKTFFKMIRIHFI